MPSGQLDPSCAKEYVWRPIVPTSHNVSFCVARQLQKRTSTLIHCDWWSLLEQQIGNDCVAPRLRKIERLTFYADAGPTSRSSAISR